MFKVTRAIILAAGLGTRLKSLTQHQPKAMMLIAGEPAIAHVIRHLVSQGIHDIAINLHHHAEQIQQYLGNGDRYHARLYYSHEPKLLNSGGGVRTAMDLLPQGQLLAVHNADILAPIPLTKLAQICPQDGCALALVANPKHNLQGDFALAHQHISSSASTSKHTFSGVSVWHTNALLHQPMHTPFSLLTAINKCIQQQQCAGLLHQNQWFDIGRHRDLIQANRLFSPYS